jgi:hypothetical protein
MEMDSGHLIIGIGCNVVEAPHIASSIGRPATCLASHNEQIASYLHLLPKKKKEEEEEEMPGISASLIEADGTHSSPPPPQPSLQITLQEGDFAKELAVDVCDLVREWVETGTDTAEQVLRDFEANMDLSEQRLRDPSAANTAGGRVRPLHLNPDGTLQVEVVGEGEGEGKGGQRTLVAEYLW